MSINSSSVLCCISCSHWLRRGILVIAILLSTTILLAQQTSAPLTTQNPASDNLSEQPAPSNPPSLLTSLKVPREESPYRAITRRQRLRWSITNSIGLSHLAGGLFTSAFGTALDRPSEYGPHWGGFADRNGMRMTGIVTGNAMEASAGYYFHEDPRYFRVPDRPFKTRVNNVVRLTFVARHDDGAYGPAYARYVAISGNNFLSNTWRPASESNVHDAIFRTAEGFAGRMAANAFQEFWPDVKKYAFHRHSQ